ncbi:MAG TPA: isoprenylcysteine carboxylmethyltransferase family protein [Blastocatellia bacterium]|nr:isoprenylcysteine carboxylmethyltransferase family protein [Blastocatellia bacterium]
MVDLNKFQRVTQRIRVPLGFIFFIFYMIFSRPTWRSLLLGAAIAAIGVAMRAWASGHLRKNESLAMGGPYAYTRNPLYLGTTLIGVGFSICGGNIWLVIGAIAFFLLIYVPVMLTERYVVGKLFPNEYPEYARHVPMFLPRLTPYRVTDQRNRFDHKLYLRYREYRAALGFLGAIVLLIAKIYWSH